MAVPLLKIDTPDIKEYEYPKSKLDPKAKEQLLIGKKVSLLNNLDEKKNLAVSSLASSAILLVGGLIAAFMVSSIFGAILIGASVILGISGSLFFVVKKHLDPKQKIEFDKDELRFAVFEKILQYDPDKLEGYDLLQKAIEDRSQDPKDKDKVYVAIRQLRRQLSRLEIQKKQFEREIENKYQDTLKRYKDDQEYKIATLPRDGVSRDERNAQIFLINKDFDENLIPWNEWKKESNKEISNQYKKAVNNLNLLYDDLLNNLGKPEPEPPGWKDYLWQKTKDSVKIIF